MARRSLSRDGVDPSNNGKESCCALADRRAGLSSGIVAGGEGAESRCVEACVRFRYQNGALLPM